MEKSSQGDLTDIIRNKTFILSDDNAFIDPFPGSKDPTGDYGVSAKKRRKSQAKKVVCIPAPAASSGRPNGEAVPSDLWAWRKYGQKPIKGSPYPRGYYRCSSSKGCSARKQVERSRTDPSMLTITYTSEHNHPWPAQRNALAGSTRSLPSSSNPHSLEQQPKQEPHLYLDHFFDDLAELDFKEGFLGENGSSGCSKAADPFSMFDWGDLMEEKRGV